MNNYFELMDIDTPSVNLVWVEMNYAERLSKVATELEKDSSWNNIIIKSCNPSGQVFIELAVPMPSNCRSTIILDFELALKKSIDDAITVWNEPLGDKSSLRRLRGVVVKS